MATNNAGPVYLIVSLLDDKEDKEAEAAPPRDELEGSKGPLLYLMVRALTDGWVLQNLECADPCLEAAQWLERKARKQKSGLCLSDQAEALVKQVRHAAGAPSLYAVTPQHMRLLHRAMHQLRLAQREPRLEVAREALLQACDLLLAFGEEVGLLTPSQGSACASLVEHCRAIA